jgi:hypothetical protein
MYTSEYIAQEGACIHVHENVLMQMIAHTRRWRNLVYILLTSNARSRRRMSTEVAQTCMPRTQDSRSVGNYTRKHEFSNRTLRFRRSTHDIRYTEPPSTALSTAEFFEWMTLLFTSAYDRCENTQQCNTSLLITGRKPSSMMTRSPPYTHANKQYMTHSRG